MQASVLSFSLSLPTFFCLPLLLFSLSPARGPICPCRVLGTRRCFSSPSQSFTLSIQPTGRTLTAGPVQNQWLLLTPVFQWPVQWAVNCFVCSFSKGFAGSLLGAWRCARIQRWLWCLILGTTVWYLLRSLPSWL